MSTVIPKGLCGIMGCVFLDRHAGKHSWQKPVSDPSATVSSAANKSPKKGRRNAHPR